LIPVPRISAPLFPAPHRILPLLLLALAAPTFGAGAVVSGAVVSGTATYDGPGLRIPALRMSADPKCEALHGGERVFASDRLVNAEGGVSNVFVYLKAAPPGTGPFPTPAEPKRLVQQGCDYQPRVQGIMVQQQLEIVNDDPTLHNVRCLARDNRPFNLGQPAKGTRTKFFTEPEEAVKFKCDVHPWMAAYFFVMDHPFFAVTDASGKFTLPALPPGTYTLHAWHESFGVLAQTVELKADKGDVAFVFHGASE
jgi:hypothetical protein